MSDNNLMTRRQLNELDQFITGHYGEDDPSLEAPPDTPIPEGEPDEFPELEEDDEDDADFDELDEEEDDAA